MTLSSLSAPVCQKRWFLLIDSGRLIPPWLFLIKCNISNQDFPYKDQSKKIVFCLFQVQKMEFEKEKTLIWYDNLN